MNVGFRGPGRPRKGRATEHEPLSRERVLRAAVVLADADGVGALSMRKLGEALGVEAMSLYHHVANKEDILDGIVDLVVSEIDIPEDGVDWRAGLRRRALATYAVLLRHPWASTLIESRSNPIPARTRSCDATIGLLRSAGFSLRQACQAFLTLDSYIYGFTLQEVSWPFEREELPQVLAHLEQKISAAEYPHVADMMRFVLEERAAESSSTTREAGYTPEFVFGLDLILDGLERMRRGSQC